MVKGLEPLIQSMKALNNEAVAVYAPLVDDICSRHATLKEVEHLLDYMLGFAGDDGFCCCLSECAEPIGRHTQKTSHGTSWNTANGMTPKVW